MWDQFLAYAGTENGERAVGVILAVLGAGAAFLLWVFGVFAAIWKKFFGTKEKKPVSAPTYNLSDTASGGFAEASAGGIATGQVSGNQTIHQGAPVGHVTLTIEQFLEHLKKERDKAQAELAAVDNGEKQQMVVKVAELESQIANPETALAEAQTRIADLEARLERMGNDVGGDRLAEARAAFQRLDYSVADEIFAEVEERQKLEVQQAARAAFGRGEIAEAEVRWPDAAEHYARAARLEPDYDTLIKAGEFLWRAGRNQDATRFREDLVSLAREEFGGEQSKTAIALNELATSHWATGAYEAAGPLLREALGITRKALGVAHPDYGQGLNNLAELLKVTGRNDEAEPLYREALEVTREALGGAHPTYARRLNNLAALLRATGRSDEAEPLFREALEITREALGAAHPDYAGSLNNLAELLLATGRYEEAEPLYRDALAVFETALGADHPDTKIVAKNLEVFLAERP